MTKFDVIVAVLVLISAAVGYLRGAIREVAAMVALFAAAFLAIFGLPSVTPIMRHFIHTPWLAALAALVLIFLVTYALLRLIGAALAQQVQRTHVLGVLDRSIGLGIGLARGLVVLGGLYLMFTAATPEDLRPHWITGSTTWPIAQRMGGVLTELAPKGLDLAGRVEPAFARAVHGGSGDRNAAEGYDARDSERDDLQVERSR